MKQVSQSFKTGHTEIIDVPAPKAESGKLLIRTKVSLISSGTERMLIDFGKAGYLQKARSQPDKVRMVLDKIRTDGLIPTFSAVKNKLDQPIALGYCNVGEVIEVGKGVSGYKVGDRVASNGKHAEFVSVPVNLCAKIPQEVTDEQAVFTVVGAIGLQGIRLIQPTLGESVVVVGLGLIGLMTVQLLRANGCRVLGIDFDHSKLQLAKEFGADTFDLSAGERPFRAADQFSRGTGVDAVIITTSTKSNDPVRDAAQMCRKRGRIVLVGISGLQLSRDDFYKKELTFQVSASYGPGRYDEVYEEKGIDYPIGFVRWTEQRNFEAVLGLISRGQLAPEKLISQRFSIEHGEKAYEFIEKEKKSLGVLLHYDAPSKIENQQVSRLSCHLSSEKLPDQISVSFIGAGNYAASSLIPAFKKNPTVNLHRIASATGFSATHVGKKFGFLEATTDPKNIISDRATDAVVVATRHNSHARFVVEALKNRKHVFVEKPLCLTLSELNEISSTYSELINQEGMAPILMVGFNRRFSPLVRKIKDMLTGLKEPSAFVMTVNAGGISVEHWTQLADVGGGRIIGEACHFIDLLRFLSDSPIRKYGKSVMAATAMDTVTLQLEFDNGSIGTIHYFSNGNKLYPKERLEIFSGGKILRLDNFRSLEAWGWKGFSKWNLWRQDKGQAQCAVEFVDAIKGGKKSPIPIEEIFEVGRIAIELDQIS